MASRWRAYTFFCPPQPAAAQPCQALLGVSWRCRRMRLSPSTVCDDELQEYRFVPNTRLTCAFTHVRTIRDRGKLLWNGDIHVCPETDAEMGFRWSGVQIP